MPEPDAFSNRKAREWVPIEHVRIGGACVATSSRAELVDAAVKDAAIPPDARVPRLVFHVNAHGLSLAARNKDHRDDLDKADILHADGGFLVTASRMFASENIKERSAVTDLIHNFASDPGNRHSFYLLGASEQVNTKAAEVLQRTYPGLRIVGRHHGFFPGTTRQALFPTSTRQSPT